MLREIWNRTYEDRKQRGVHTQAAFGAEYDIGNQAAVGFFLNGQTALSLKAAIGFAKGLGCEIADFSPRLALQVADLVHAVKPAAAELTLQGHAPAVRVGPAEVKLSIADVPPGAAELRSVSMVPVVGTTQAGPPDRAWEETGHPVGHGDQYVEVATSDRNAYALRVVGDSMAPRIMEGEWIVVEPNVEPMPGDEVVVKTVDGEVMVKVLSARHGDTVVLLSINEAFKRITKHMSEIEFIHYVGPRLPARAVKTRVELPSYHGPDRRLQARAVSQDRRRSDDQLLGGMSNFGDLDEAPAKKSGGR